MTLPNKSLLIVGNGFDLSLSAKTRYSDFISFVKDCLYSSNDNNLVNKYPNYNKVFYLNLKSVYVTSLVIIIF